MIAALLVFASLARAGCGDDPAREIARALHEKDGRAELQRSRDDLLNYFSYEAYAKRDVRVCDGLAPLHSDRAGSVHHEDDVCRTKYYELVYVEALVRRSPSLIDACSADARWSGLSPEAADAICRLRAAEFEKLGASPSVAAIARACKTMTASADAKQKAKCTPYVRAFFGDDGDCRHAGALVPKDEVAHDVEQCRSFAAFARETRGRGGCEGHEICRALSGKAAEAAEARARAVASAICVRSKDRAP